MRIAVLAGIAGLLLLILGAFLEEKHWEKAALESRDPRAVQAFKDDFRHLSDPMLRFTLANLPQVRLDPALAQSGTRLPVYHSLERSELALLLKAAQDCSFPSGSIAASATVVKALIWQRFVCHPEEALPANFFRTAPFLHPGGSSYALLAFTSGRSPFASREWLTLHRDALHVLELPILKDYLDLHPLQGLMAGMGEEGAQAVLSGEPLVLTTAHALIIEDPRRAVFRSVLPRYEVYARGVWDQAMGDSFFNVSEKVEDQNAIVYQEGHLYWTLKRSRMQSSRSVYRMTSVSGLILAAISLLAMALIQVRSRIRDHEERLFVLQTLTHEIRTPATALNLAVEDLRDNFDQLNEMGQKALMRMLSATSRLGRVLEASTQYLKSERRLGSLAVELQEIPSMKEWLLDILPHGIELKLQDDFAFMADSYWLATAIENLGQNALKHGGESIKLWVRTTGSQIQMMMEDSGNLSPEKARELGIPFAKGDKSDGLGLGLVLVRRIAESMGGRLFIQTGPTRFTVEIKHVQNSSCGR